MQRRRYLAATGGLAVPLAGCLGGSDDDGSGGDGDTGGDGAAVVETTDVSMVASQFDPRNVHVSAGATVTWTNEDGAAHTVTAASDNWSFDENVPGGEATQYTFESSGVYDVYCTYHGSADLTGMSMKVGVGDATIEEPLGGSGGGGGGGPY